MSALECRVEAVDGQTWLYRMVGDLFGSPQGYAFQEDVRQKVAAGARRIVLDLAQVRRIDSCGVGILVTVMWSASHAGGALALASLPPHVERVLGLALLLDRITNAATVPEALAKLDAK